jgi:hypothetical protein
MALNKERPETLLRRAAVVNRVGIRVEVALRIEVNLHRHFRTQLIGRLPYHAMPRAVSAIPRDQKVAVGGRFDRAVHRVLDRGAPNRIDPPARLGRSVGNLKERLRRELGPLRFRGSSDGDSDDERGRKGVGLGRHGILRSIGGADAP